jgi:hypothetical protein
MVPMPTAAFPLRAEGTKAIPACSLPMVVSGRAIYARID